MKRSKSKMKRIKIWPCLMLMQSVKYYKLKLRIDLKYNVWEFFLHISKSLPFNELDIKLYGVSCSLLIFLSFPFKTLRTCSSFLSNKKFQVVFLTSNSHLLFQLQTYHSVPKFCSVAESFYLIFKHSSIQRI